MSRSVSSELQAHLDSGMTTTCRLLKVKSGGDTPVIFGLTSLDIDVAYDDGSGDGEVVYSATRGFDPTAMRSTVGYGIDNAEAKALLSADVEGVTAAMVDAGVFDDGTWVCYMVNYKDLTMGHIELGGGDIGDIHTRYGMVWIPELLDTMVRLKQPVGVVTSRKCRAIFGNPATQEYRQTGCGVDVSAMWTAGVVQSVDGAESNRIFTGDALATPHSYPGRVRFTTGDNVGRVFAVEVVTGFEIELVETTPYPIQAGDEYEIRPDCGKRYEEDCIEVWNNGPNFKGEPLMPDGSEVAAPQ